MRLSEYAAIATLLGPEVFPVVDNPGVVGGTKKITAANLAASAPFSSRYQSGRSSVILTDAAQAIANATVTDITWGTEVSDPDGWTSGGSATLTVPPTFGSRYHVCYTGQWSASVGASAGVACLYNGVTFYAVMHGGLWNVSTLDFLRTMAAGDTLKFQVFQSNGAPVNVTSRLELVG